MPVALTPEMIAKYALTEIEIDAGLSAQITGQGAKLKKAAKKRQLKAHLAAMVEAEQPISAFWSKFVPSSG